MSMFTPTKAKESVRVQISHEHESNIRVWLANPSDSLCMPGYKCVGKSLFMYCNYVWMYVCTYVCVYVCMCVWMNVCMYVPMYPRWQTFPMLVRGYIIIHTRYNLINETYTYMHEVHSSSTTCVSDNMWVWLPDVRMRVWMQWFDLYWCCEVL